MSFPKIHGTPGCKTTYTSNIPHWLNFLCTLPLQAENYRHWNKVSSSWKQSLDCYLQSISYTESKDSLPRRHSTIHYQAWTTGHKAVSQVLIPLCSPLLRGNKTLSRKSSFWGESCTLQSYMSVLCHSCPYLGLLTLKTEAASFAPFTA